MMILLSCHFVFIAVINGFLLDSQNGNGQTTTSRHYLTMSEFLEAKKQQKGASEELHHETEQLRHEVDELRHDTDNTLNLLTSQIQDKLDAIEQNMFNVQCNDSKMPDQNYEEVVKNYTILQQDFERLQSSFYKQQQELVQRTTTFDREFQALKQLQNIKQLQDFHALQQTVQSIKSQTHSLAVNELARKQDFIALYNATLMARQNLTDFELLTGNRFLEVIINENQTFANIHNFIHDLEAKLRDFRQEINETANILFQELQDMRTNSSATNVIVQEQIQKINTKVAMTACVLNDYGTLPQGHIIKFSDIRSSTNISNLNAFINSGKFTCQIDGLYLVSAWVLSNKYYAEYSIMKNGNMVARAFITSDNNGSKATATAVAALDLQKGDKVWVEVYINGIYIYDAYGQESCLTIVNVK